MKKINYLVLARKYRPKVLSDFEGQEEVCAIIKSAILNNRLAHAYLFSGTRGVGKTTLARLVAKIVNCLKRNDNEVEPCGNCENCHSISLEKNMDIVEIDAASKTGVSDVREIIENVNYKPVTALKKIYIIDEVHMLSKAAFNALLKTLEEPPKDVLFLLATTETEKIPVTILSRCQRLNLKRISIDILMKQISKISKVEGYELPNESTNLIARCAEGSMRDALSILDNILIHKKNIDKKTIQQILKIEDFSNVIKLFEKVCEGNVKETLNLVNEFYKRGNSFENLAKDILNIIFQISKYKSLNEFEDNFISDEEKKKYIELAKNFEMDFLIRLWELMQKYFRELTTAIDQKQYFEMSMIRLCYVSLLPTPFESKTGKFEIEKTRPKNNQSDNLELQTENNLALNVQPITDKNKEEDNGINIESQMDKFCELINELEANGDLILSHKIKSNFRLVSLRCHNEKNIHGEIELENFKQIKLEDNELWKLTKKIQEITKKRWLVTLSSKKGFSSIAEIENNNRLKAIEEISKNQRIKKLLEIIPKSKVISIQKIVKRK